MNSPAGGLRGASPARGSRMSTPGAASQHGSRRVEAGNLVVDDLLQGMHEWRNIQDVIRNTFKALHDVIKAQGDAVKNIERQLETKASNADAQAALLRKANITDVNRSLTDITHALEGKASVYEIENKPDRSEVQLALKGKASLADIHNKADREDFEVFRSHYERHMQVMAVRMDEMQAEIDRRLTKEECMQLLDQRIGLDDDDRAGARRSVMQMLHRKADRADMDGLPHKVEAASRRANELSERLEGVVRETAGLLGEQQAAVRREMDHKMDRPEGQTVLAGLAKLEELMGQTARRDDVVKALAAKADWEDVRRQMSQKASLVDLEAKPGFDALEESMGVQEQALQRMAELVTSVQRDMSAVSRKMEEAVTRMQVKADMKDVNVLMDGKADVDEVNRALLDVNAQLNMKASMADMAATLQEQALLNSTLISELCLGRWIWKSLKTKTGGAVPWNIQTANSDPSNLLWEKDKTYICCVSPGLYEVQFGFFSRRKPVVKMHVNGEPVMTVNGAPPSVCYHAGGRLLSSGRYTNSNITGLTHIDFIALPAKAKISMSYQGDEDAEAFMTLRKF